MADRGLHLFGVDAGATRDLLRQGVGDLSSPSLWSGLAEGDSIMMGRYPPRAA